MSRKLIYPIFFAAAFSCVVAVSVQPLRAETLREIIPTANSVATLAVQQGIVKMGDLTFDRLRFMNDMAPHQYERLIKVSGDESLMRGQRTHRGDCIGANPTLWFQQIGVTMDLDDSDDEKGYGSNAYGFMIGADKRLHPHWIIGGGIGGTFATVDSGWTQQATANSLLLDAYGAYTYDDWTLGALIGYARTESDVKHGRSDAWFSGEFTGDSFWAGVDLSKKFRFRYCDLSPYYSLQFVTLNTGGFYESSDKTNAVWVDGQSPNSLLQNLGLRFSRTVRAPRGAIWNPSFSFGWIHDYGSGELRSDLMYGDTTYVSPIGTVRRCDRGTIGLGLNVAIRRMMFFGGYDAEFAERYYAGTTNFGFNFMF